MEDQDYFSLLLFLVERIEELEGEPNTPCNECGDTGEFIIRETSYESLKMAARVCRVAMGLKEK